MLKNVTYLDTISGKYVTGKQIKFQDGVIISITDNKEGDGIDCKGKFVLPGLIDSHIHFFQSAGLYTRPDGLDLRHIKSYENEIKEIRENIPSLFRRYLACGVTGVVDCGGPFWNFEVLDESRRLLSPKVAVAGPLISTVPREKLDIGDPPIIQATSIEHAKELVKECVTRKPKFVKIWFIYREEEFETDSKIIQGTIEEIHRLGFKAAVHATELETAKRAVKFGADILVHSVFNEDVDDEFVELVVKNRVIYIPTLMVRNGYRDVYRTRMKLSEFEQIWGDAKVIASWRDLMVLPENQIPEAYRPLRREYDKTPQNLLDSAYYNLRRLYNAGAIIATGTDAGNVGTLHGPSLHTEMKMMVEAGMTPKDVILATTIRGAQLIGGGGFIGEGASADLIILDSDPTVNINAIDQINSVIIEGKLFKPYELITPTTRESLITSLFVAINDKKMEQILAHFHPRVLVRDFRTREILYSGIDALKNSFEATFTMKPTIKQKVGSMFSFKDLVIVKELLTQENKSITELLSVYKVENHLITELLITNK